MAVSVYGVSSGGLVQAQRGRKTPKKHVWEVPGHAGRHLPDLEELIGSQARERTQVFSSAKANLNKVYTYLSGNHAENNNVYKNFSL